MRRQRVVKLALAAGMVGLLILPALVYTQVTGGVLNPRKRKSYTSLSAAVADAAANDTLLVSGTLTDGNATLSAMPIPDGLKIVAGRGFRGKLQVSVCPLLANPPPGSPSPTRPNRGILDVSGRLGALTIQGLQFVVPNGCVAVYSTANGNPLTVRDLSIMRDSAASSIWGVILWEENAPGGPFTMERNVMGAGTVVGLWIEGDSATSVTAFVRRNTIRGARRYGIVVTDLPAGSGVIVEGNLVDGGNHPDNVVGIGLWESNGVTIWRNTVRNFVGTTFPGWGITISESPNVQVIRNVVANNGVGVLVDDISYGPGETAATVVINFNNITSTVTGAIGLSFLPNSSVTVPLDATNNWWGAANGPRDDDSGDPPDCPEATPPGCTTPPTAEGGGLPIATNPLASQPNTDCGAGAGLVRTCPFWTAPVSPAGA
jgi:hypothetical protein